MSNKSFWGLSLAAAAAMPFVTFSASAWRAASTWASICWVFTYAGISPVFGAWPLLSGRVLMSNDPAVDSRKKQLTAAVWIWFILQKWMRGEGSCLVVWIWAFCRLPSFLHSGVPGNMSDLSSLRPSDHTQTHSCQLCYSIQAFPFRLRRLVGINWAVPGIHLVLRSDWSAGCRWSLQGAASFQGCCYSKGVLLTPPLLLSMLAPPCLIPWDKSIEQKQSELTENQPSVAYLRGPETWLHGQEGWSVEKEGKLMSGCLMLCARHPTTEHYENQKSNRRQQQQACRMSAVSWACQKFHTAGLTFEKIL